MQTWCSLWWITQLMQVSRVCLLILKNGSQWLPETGGNIENGQQLLWITRFYFCVSHPELTMFIAEMSELKLGSTVQQKHKQTGCEKAEFPFNFEVKLKRSAPEMFVTIPHGTGKLCAHYGKHSRSKFKQEVGLLRMLTTATLGNYFTVYLYYLLKINLISLQHVWSSDCSFLSPCWTYFLAILPCSQILALNLLSLMLLQPELSKFSFEHTWL